jgi:hypothetical protein
VILLFQCEFFIFLIVFANIVGFYLFFSSKKKQIFLQTFATKGYQVMLGLNENKVIKYLFGCHPVKMITNRHCNLGVPKKYHLTFFGSSIMQPRRFLSLKVKKNKTEETFVDRIVL